MHGPVNIRILLLTRLSADSACAYHMFRLTLLVTVHYVHVHMELFTLVNTVE